MKLQELQSQILQLSISDRASRTGGLSLAFSSVCIDLNSTRNFIAYFSKSNTRVYNWS